jgi:stearoyl-CoA desaturase (delta-9 desaturase)
MGYLQPGGMGLLREYAVPVKGDGGSDKWKEATWAFNGGVNKHSQVARRKLKQLSVALLTMT